MLYTCKNKQTEAAKSTIRNKEILKAREPVDVAYIAPLHVLHAQFIGLKVTF